MMNTILKCKKGKYDFVIETGSNNDTSSDNDMPEKYRQGRFGERKVCDEIYSVNSVKMSSELHMDEMHEICTFVPSCPF